MEIELIQDGKGVDYNKYRDVIENVKEFLFRRNMSKETKEWIYISNFVGILFDKNRLILSLPKSVIIKEDVDKETLLYKYARLFDLYFMVNEKKCDFIDKNGFIEYWCNQAIKENKTTTMTQEIITFKFEMVFEWMIGEFFHNQISIQKGDVLFNSQLLDKEININDTKYNTYKYNGLPVGPISSISTGIIKNVLNYKESEYYYFFATQDGKVLFAKTYEEHQANVKSNKWY